jgi:glutathione synthase/RimK-type ligase-like ATP-grasp enzyme
VDVKEFEGKPYVIEVNECPNIDHGVEDVAWVTNFTARSSVR